MFGQVEPQVTDTVFSRSEAIARKHYRPVPTQTTTASALPIWTRWAPYAAMGIIGLIIFGTVRR